MIWYDLIMQSQYDHISPIDLFGSFWFILWTSRAANGGTPSKKRRVPTSSDLLRRKVAISRHPSTKPVARRSCCRRGCAARSNAIEVSWTPLRPPRRRRNVWRLSWKELKAMVRWSKNVRNIMKHLVQPRDYRFGPWMPWIVNHSASCQFGGSIMLTHTQVTSFKVHVYEAQVVKHQVWPNVCVQPIANCRTMIIRMMSSYSSYSAKALWYNWRSQELDQIY